MNELLFDNRRFAVTILALALVIWLVAPAMGQTPLITLEPKDQSVSPGATVVFKAAGTGQGPLYYQWLHDGEPMATSTNTSLSITNVELINAGEYRLTVSNALGVVSSKAAILDVDPTFRMITGERIVTDGGDSTGVAWGDFNGDGWPDLFV